jgi:hypothetical protein
MDTRHVYVNSDSRDNVKYTNENSYTLHLTTAIKDIVKVELLHATVPNINTEASIFLDILELRTPFNEDAKALSGTPGFYSGQTMQRSFAMVPMDYGSVADYRQFNKMSDYDFVVDYPTPIRKLDRLTIQWIKKDGTVIPSGSKPNSFLLRFHTIRKDFCQ